MLKNNKQKQQHSFLVYLVPQYLLIYLNSAWRRIAADIKVKVKRARRLQGIVPPHPPTVTPL